MESTTDDTTMADANRVLEAYEAIVALASTDLAPDARRMRDVFAARTGQFGPEDPWFEVRSRAFWDDALTTQGFAELAASKRNPQIANAARFNRAHRGLLVVRDANPRGVHVVDLWSGAELLVHPLDKAQAVTFEHAQGPMDARVVAGPVHVGRPPGLFVLPGALHHGYDALAPCERVLEAARDRALSTSELLDALLRMELTFRRSSRVKPAYAYRVESLPRARPEE